MLSQISSQASQSISDDFLQSTERKNLYELREIREECTCVTLATIIYIEKEYNWFYNACKKCKRKAKPDGGKFRCDYCHEYVKVVVPRTMEYSCNPQTIVNL